MRLRMPSLRVKRQPSIPKDHFDGVVVDYLEVHVCICDTHPSSYCHRHMIFSSPLCPAALSRGGGFERPPDVSRQLLEIRDPGPDSADPLHMQLLIPTHTVLRPARAQRTPSQTQSLQRERPQPAPGLLAARHRRHEGPVERYECLCLHSSSS